ncbi:hypothetical protein X777_13807 [Ooceraea biroi]|uniref:Uncharacterized protein n=1 Tax=Ooceraea biroi TaxID=2015173 RepID=A0A026VXB9_OOCBI|nr:hypothetical protein X777_13807 [Ooceraea biroi]
MKFLEQSAKTMPRVAAWGCAYRERSAPKPITRPRYPFSSSSRTSDIDERDRVNGKRDEDHIGTVLRVHARIITRSINSSIARESVLLYLRESLGPRGPEEARLPEVLPRKSLKQITRITATKFQSRPRCNQPRPDRNSAAERPGESLPDRENRNWDTQVIPGGFP